MNRTTAIFASLILVTLAIVFPVTALLILQHRQKELEKKTVSVKVKPIGLNIAQPPNETSPEQVAYFGAISFFAWIAIIVISTFIVRTAILFWVAKDAKARGMEGAMWAMLIVTTGFLGFGVYMFSRPYGSLMPCSHCGNNRLAVSAKCPACGNA